MQFFRGLANSVMLDLNNVFNLQKMLEIFNNIILKAYKSNPNFIVALYFSQKSFAFLKDFQFTRQLYIDFTASHKKLNEAKMNRVNAVQEESKQASKKSRYHLA